MIVPNGMAIAKQFPPAICPLLSPLLLLLDPLSVNVAETLGDMVI